MGIVILLSVWVLCGVLGYGLMFSYLQGEYKAIASSEYREDLKASLFVAFFGPLGLFALFMTGTFTHGVKFK
jgi:hypothetical protein